MATPDLAVPSAAPQMAKIIENATPMHPKKAAIIGHVSCISSTMVILLL